MIEKSLRFLLNVMEEFGTWRFYPRNNSKFVYLHGLFKCIDMGIIPDLDDTACVSHALRSHGVDFPSNESLFCSSMTSAGIFSTWLLSKKTLIREQDYVPLHNDTCCGVNANILMYLGDNSRTKGASDYINNVILYGDQPVETITYFPNPLALYYLVSRAYSAGVHSLVASRDRITVEILRQLGSNQSTLDILSIILAVASLLNFDRFDRDLKKWVDIIIDFQDVDGSWPTKTFFIDTVGGNNYGSRELTTAIALEVVSKASLLMVFQ